MEEILRTASLSTQEEEVRSDQSQPERKSTDTSPVTHSQVSPPLRFQETPNLVDLPWIVAVMRTKKFYSTELASGSVAQAWLRNNQYGETMDLGKYHLENKLRKIGEYQLNGVVENGIFKVFDVIDLKENRYFPCMDILKFCEDLGIHMVQLLSAGYRFNYSAMDLDSKSRNMPSRLKGIIYRTMRPEWVHNHRLALKVKNINYEAK